MFIVMAACDTISSFRSGICCRSANGECRNKRKTPLRNAASRAVSVIWISATASAFLTMNVTFSSQLNKRLPSTHAAPMELGWRG